MSVPQDWSRFFVSNDAGDSLAMYRRVAAAIRPVRVQQLPHLRPDFSQRWLNLLDESTTGA